MQGGSSKVGVFTNAGSTLDIDLASIDSFDSLSISSDLAVGGVLSVHLLPGYLAQVGASFQIASFDKRVGGSRFSCLNSNCSNGIQFEARHHANDITLRVTAVTAVPEPGTWALLLAGLGLTGYISRRKLNA